MTNPLARTVRVGTLARRAASALSTAAWASVTARSSRATLARYSSTDCAAATDAAEPNASANATATRWCQRGRRGSDIDQHPTAGEHLEQPGRGKEKANHVVDEIHVLVQ